MFPAEPEIRRRTWRVRSEASYRPGISLFVGNARVEPCDRPAVALIRPCFAAQNLEQGRLARAVGTEQGHVVSGEQIEVDMIQGAEALHGNGYLAETDNC